MGIIGGSKGYMQWTGDIIEEDGINWIVGILKYVSIGGGQRLVV